ncbi:hexaprenyl pyrophosphate synthetase [Grosmannia clavigera kw1407]|uniref:Hexaprenyl pyrophosphate synthetase n=1 Tax=Grosmannia clavigera (strain kw1407 / UAMH 11150) TaxID=655863 RepID=F0X8Z5_GROCL|nr:hexaprenyl pyrophosphate synthetase [Grosmannia clavigera kw1407]EFX05439.1 hexaprenyl pyrophosphate synthetase [Grosmannia clavigera kw1407]
MLRRLPVSQSTPGTSCRAIPSSASSDAHRTSAVNLRSREPSIASAPPTSTPLVPVSGPIDRGDTSPTSPTTQTAAEQSHGGAFRRWCANGTVLWSSSDKSVATAIASINDDSSAWSAAVSVAGNIVSNAISRAKKNEMAIDPLRVVAKEMKYLIGDVRKLLGSGHPSLDRAAKYYTQAEGKHMRPLIVLLMSRATFQCPKAPPSQAQLSEAQADWPLSPSATPPLQAAAGVDASISPLNVLSDFNPAWGGKSPLVDSTSITIPSSFTPSSPSSAAAAAAESDAAVDTNIPDILPSQRRLAEITELIHTASLLHDDVIDHSESRRGAPSANLEFGNKMAVLAGDFLLGRASVALARLRNAEVVELLSTVIANLVEGEFMQLKNTARDETNPVWSEATLQYYLQKTYLKTASLISKSCRAAALLGGADAQTVDAAYAYGKNLGLAFQLVDDMLDYTRSAKDLGKPAGADLELGLATAPLLFAWRENPELGALVGRKFAQPGDVARAREIVLASDGVEQTRALAQDYAEQAIAAISAFPESDAKNGLVEMAIKTLKRQK